MGTIKVHEFITVDGVVEAPAWTFSYTFDPRMGEAIGGIMGSCRAILLGRQTFAEFAPAWSSRPDDEPGAPFMNETAKYVVSSSPALPTEWNNSSVLGRYDAATIRALKDRTDGGIYVSGSATLVRALLADGLVDELHLFVFPLALGSGKKLFTEGGPAAKLALAASEVYENGALHLTYTPA